MNLRLRLIVAFFLLSVVPLGALTLYGYVSNAKAVREAAQREAELLAGELSGRMQVVTAQLSAQFSDRVERLMNAQNPAASTPSAVARSTPASKAPVAAAAPSASTTATTAAAGDEKVADALGGLSMLLNNVQLTNMGGGRGGRGGGGRGRGGPGGPNGGDPGQRGGGPFPPGGRGPNAGPNTGPNTGPSAGPNTAPNTGPTAGPNTPPNGTNPDGTPFRRFRANGDPSAAPTDGRGRGPAPDGRGQVAPGAVALSANTPPSGPQPNRPPFPGPPPGSTSAPADDKDRITIDMMPIRRGILEQYGTQEEWQKMPEADRQRIMGEVNQRMLGIAMGIQLGTAEAQKRIADAQHAADEAAKAAATKAAAAKAKAAPAASSSAPSAAPAAPTVPAAPMQHKATLSGSHLDLTMERNGEVVQQANAEVNLTNLLGTVFSTTRRERGEVPFAVAKDGHVYTPTDDDGKKVAALGSDAAKPETPPGTAMVQDWIVVTTADPTGSGLKFGIARPVGDSLNELRRTTVRNAGFGLGFIGLALIGIVPLSSRLTRNLSTLSEGVRRIADGDYRARVEVRSHDEIGQLALAFNQMAEDVEQHQRAAVGQERIRRELELGRQIQHDMLPSVPLRLGLTEIKGVSVPAREVGGDFFNYFQVPNGQVALLMGDVSGKGVGAALLMANIQASLRTRLALGQDLASLAREIDSEIEASTPGAVYATLFVAMLDLETHQLSYVNAGHHAQYVLRPGGGLEGMPSSGLPVGLLAGHGYTERRVQLEPGDILFFYTDGCVEAENESDEEFGTERLEALLRSRALAGADDVLAYVEGEFVRFRGSREPFDDATMMAVKVG